MILENVKLAPHEALELNELLQFKMVCASKAAMLGDLVKDIELRDLLRQEFRKSQQEIQDLQRLLQAAL